MAVVYKKGKVHRISQYFKSTEFDCKCKGYCSTTILDTRLIEYLQRIREHFNKPVYINSGYRCYTHNKNVGGVSKSKHLLGMAADIRVKDTAPIDVARYAESIGVKGIGLYDTFTHIDSRVKKAYWYGHKQEYRGTFK